MGYDYDISYKKGKENLVADALSRMNSAKLMVMAVFGISSELMSEIEKSWDTDEELQSLISQLQQNTLQSSVYSWSNNQLTKGES